MLHKGQLERKSALFCVCITCERAPRAPLYIVTLFHAYNTKIVFLLIAARPRGVHVLRWAICWGPNGRRAAAASSHGRCRRGELEIPYISTVSALYMIRVSECCSIF